MTDRQELGQEIAQKFRAVRRINESRYSVKSQSAKGKYDIYQTKIGWTCSCPDHKFRGIKCKAFFEKMRAPPDAITSAMQLYFTGESFRNVMRFLNLRGRKYVTLMQSYVEKVKLPSLGNAWRTDELNVKVKGNMKYMYALTSGLLSRFLVRNIPLTLDHYSGRRKR
jgi:hypothetical protein